MDQKQIIFIKVAEAMSMSKVAEKNYMTHQAVSQHIKNLEAEYDTQLFVRKPKLALTTAGETVLEMLYRMQTMEKNLLQVLAEDNSKQNIHGSIKLGVPSSRYSVIVPSLYNRLLLLYPGIKLDIVDDYANELLKETRKGILDMAIIPQQSYSEGVNMFPLAEDVQLLIVSDKMLRNIYPHEYPGVIERFKQGVPSNELINFPLINTPVGSRAHEILTNFRTPSGHTLNFVFESNHWYSYPRFARYHVAAAILSHQFFDPIFRTNCHCGPDQYLHVFPVNMQELNYPKEIMLVYNREQYVPIHQLKFIEIVKKMFKQYDFYLNYIYEAYKKDPAFLRAVQR